VTLLGRAGRLLCAVLGGQMQIAVPRSKTVSRLMSVLAQGFADAALGELILAHDASAVDPQQHVDAVPGPFGDLSQTHAAVEPGGQTCVPKVVAPPGGGRGLLRCRERGLACLDPCAPAGGRGQLATPRSAEQVAIWRGAELCKVMAQEPRQLRVVGTIRLSPSAIASAGSAAKSAESAISHISAAAHATQSPDGLCGGVTG